MAKICIVNGVYPPDVYGGAENYVQRTAKELSLRGHDVSVLTTTSNQDKESLRIHKDVVDGIPVYRFYPLNLYHRSEGSEHNIVTKALWHQIDTFNPHAKRIVSDFLNSHQPDVVHTNNFMGITASVGSAISESNARYVHTLHDYSLICPKSNLLRDATLPDDELGVCDNPPAPCQLFAKSKRRAIGRPDLVIGPSQHVIDIHRQQGFFSGIESVRVQHGVRDCANTVPDQRTNAVLYVGKHLRAKGLDTLYEAARKLPEVVFHLCGTGPYDDQSRTIAEELKNVLYHGYVSDERLGELRQEVAAGVVPSIWMENSPLTIYENFAQGLPVIGADIGGIPELVNEDRGWLFEPSDSSELAKKIHTAVFESNSENIRSNALKWAKNHSFDSHISKLLDCYDV